MQTWEYLALTRAGGRWSDDHFDGRAPSEKLTDLGKDGWELVSVCYDGSGYNFYLKKVVGDAKASAKKSKVK
jgi:hypothetical protein